MTHSYHWMVTRTQEVTELTRQRISEALFLIGFGIVWALDWLWPGVVVSFGVAWAASLVVRRKFWASTVVAIVLCAVPISYSLAESLEMSAPFVVVGIGAAGLVRAFYLRK